MVLIGRDRREARLLEHEGLVVLLRVFLAVLAWVHVHHVEPGLVAVHGVQNDLRAGQRTDQIHIRHIEFIQTWIKIHRLNVHKPHY